MPLPQQAIVDIKTLTGLSDVLITSASDDDILQYDSGTGLWKNVSPVAALTGYYALLDGSNQPFTGDLQIKSSIPQFTLFDTTTDAIVSGWSHNPTGGITKLEGLVYRPGGAGYALQLNGTTQAVTIPKDPTIYLDGEYTIGCFFRMNGDYTTLQIFMADVDVTAAVGASFSLEIGRAANKISALANVATVAITSTGGINDDDLHLVVLTKSGVSGNWDYELFIDGVSDTVVTGSVHNVDIFGSIGNPAIGRAGDYIGAGSHLNATVDGTTIYKGRVLSDNDIADWWGLGTPLLIDKDNNFPTDGSSMGTNLAGLWQTDEPSGSTTEDSSVNSNTGTLVNTPTRVSGLIPSLGADITVTMLKIKDGENALEPGILTLGQDASNSPTIQYKGGSHHFFIGSEEIGEIDGNGTLIWDNGEPTSPQQIIRVAAGASENALEVQGNAEAVLAAIDETGNIGAGIAPLYRFHGYKPIGQSLGNIESGDNEAWWVVDSAVAQNAGVIFRKANVNEWLVFNDASGIFKIGPSTGAIKFQITQAGIASFEDNNIINVGDISLDSITSDDGTGPIIINDDILMSSVEKIYLRDIAIGAYSQADGYGDLFADIAWRIGNSSAGAPTTYVSFEPDGDASFTGEGSGWPFGGIYVEGVDEDTVLAAQDTYYQVLAWSSGGAAGLTCEANMITPDAAGNSHITIVKGGKYLVNWHVSVYAVSKNIYEFEIHANNGTTGYPCTEAYLTTSVASAINTAAGQGHCNFETGDTVELWVERKDGAAVSKTLTFRQATISITQVGGT